MDLPFVREAVKNLFSRSSCDMYPLKPSEAAEQYRGRIEYDPTKCINCHFCERVCAGGAITVVEVPVEEGTQITRTFDLSTCTFCNTCADFCNTHAIKLTKDYHMIGLKEGDLLVSGTFVKAAKKKPAPPPAEAKPEEKAAPAIKPRDDGKPVQDPSKCVYCGICAKKCLGEALTVDRKEKLWKLDEDKCVSCGTCEEVCPKKAIIM